MTISSYQTLYNNSVLFSIKKNIDSWKPIPSIEKKMEELKERKKKLLYQAVNLQRECEYLEEKEKKITDDLRRKYIV